MASGFYEGTFRRELLFGEKIYLVLENSSEQAFEFQILWTPRSFAIPLFIVIIPFVIFVYSCSNVKYSKFLYYPIMKRN